MQHTIKLVENGLSQEVPLPGELHFEGTNVMVREDAETGNMLPSRKNKNFDEFFRLRDQLTQEELDQFVVPPRDRTPMRIPDLGD